jgi:hypothetical protein
MEEVVGSIPTRSTIFSTTCRYPTFHFGSIWQENARPVRDPFQIRKGSKLGTDGVDRLLRALRNLLHVNVSCRCHAGVSEPALNVLHRPLLLSQRRNSSPDHLEGQLGQLKYSSSCANPCRARFRQLLLSMNPPFLFGKMNAFGDGLGHRCCQSHRSSARTSLPSAPPQLLTQCATWT